MERRMWFQDISRTGNTVGDNEGIGCANVPSKFRFMATSGALEVQEKCHSV